MHKAICWRLVFVSILVAWSSCSLLHAQDSWELELNDRHRKSFEAAYTMYPSIPKGMLEAVAYTNTHIRHLQPLQAQPSCLGLPVYYGVMGLVEDGKGYFRNNLLTVAQHSSYSVEEIKENAHASILAYAEAYDRLVQDYNINSKAPEDHTTVLDALSELPNDGSVQNNYAFDSHCYSVFMHLNDPQFQSAYHVPAYQINLEEVFGENRYEILSASALILDKSGIQSASGLNYVNGGLRNAVMCSDLSDEFPYQVIQDSADPSNYSSRSGIDITHVTIHTMQGSYAGAISWFKNPNSNVSAHYNMRSADGQITQMVCEIDKAWHVRNSNPYTIGIEHEGYVDDPSWYTDITYTVSAALTEDIAMRYGIPLVRTYDVNGDLGIHTLSDGCFKVKGHQHYPSQTHTDPGPFWDWNRYYDLLNPVAEAIVNTFTDSSGTFFDSGGPASDYADDERVFYRIDPPDATGITLTFNHLDLELDYDYLYVYDGFSHDDPLLAKLNGSNIPDAIYATSGKMLLEFRSDCGILAAGWEASWTSHTTAVACENPTNLTTVNHDHNGAELTWSNVDGAQSYEIKIRQSIGSIPETIYDSDTNNIYASGLASDARYLWSVRAICGSGDTSVASGSAFVNAVATTDFTTSECTGTFTDTGGELGSYRDYEDYAFTISPNNATSVTLAFSAFELESNYDFLYIHDGADIDAPLLGVYTDTDTPPITKSSGESLTVRFISDINTQSPGWIASWTCTRCIVAGIDSIVACDRYTWIDGNTYVTSNDTATYLIIEGAASGCDSLVTLNLTIRSVDTSVSQSDAVLTSNQSGATYQWLDCNNNYAILDGKTDQAYTASTSGLFAVEVNYAGCIDTSSCYPVTILAVSDDVFKNKILVYPNPTADIVSIDLGGSYTSVRVLTKNITGQILRMDTFKNTKKFTLDLGPIPGVYILEIITHEHDRAIIKVIKE